VNLALLEMVWDAGYTFDCLSYPDDLGYRNGVFFDLDTYRAVLKPAHKRSCDWAHQRGVRVMLHSCGNIMELIPDLIDAGFDGLNPLETKAGMDLIDLKENIPDRYLSANDQEALEWLVEFKMKEDK